MPRIPLNQHKPKTPLARLRREFLFHKGRKHFYQSALAHYTDGKRFYQSDLARDLGVSTARIQQIELGTEALPPKHALKLQEIYGISADWLLKGDPKAKPVTPKGKPYSRAIATNSRRSYQIRLSKEPTANLAWHLSLSLETLLSEIRDAIIRANQEKGLTAAASLFSEIRDAVLPPLKDAEPSASIVSSLHAEAERLFTNPGKYEQWRLDLTKQHLGVEEHRIISPDGKEMEFQPVSPKDKTIEFPDAQIIDPDGKVIGVRPMTPEEVIKFQPAVLPKEGIAPQPLTEDKIRALFDPIRKRMKAKGKTEDEIRARLDDFRKRQRAAEGKISPSSV